MMGTVATMLSDVPSPGGSVPATSLSAVYVLQTNTLHPLSGDVGSQCPK